MNTLTTLRNQFAGKRILVVGLGFNGGGVGLVNFFTSLESHVTITDNKTKEELESSLIQIKSSDVTLKLGGHSQEDFLYADYIFKGPSVPWNMPYIVEAEKRGIPVEMEASFFASICPAPIVGVTGTRGKSTTSSIIYQLLLDNGYRTHLGGNVSQVSTISLLNDLDNRSVVVLELSSWQLSGFHRRKISPHVAVLTNLYPDHLNFYHNMDAYFYDKKAIYQYQKAGDVFVYHKLLEPLLDKKEIKAKPLTFDAKTFSEQLINLRGEHNYANAGAALKVSEAFNIDIVQAMKSIRKFAGLPYRQQIIRKMDRLIFINDTSSTTPVAAVQAIKSFSDKPIIQFLGGNAKRLPTDELLHELEKVEHIVLLAGSFTDEIIDRLRELYPEKLSPIYDNLSEAVREGIRLAKIMNTETYLLFSPGATSFAMFKNEFHRGDEFNRIVLGIKE
ncbi:UDP-N-acetylmuramoyl-L-alanine--D-glutamate ligase [Candidatus Roizmanbacteria bacterium]|nr:UDP-N-acetylmuramoyl-L-alanine--D-glutamate ligase [Candidatus Roizmanbacteria bacterium]